MNLVLDLRGLKGKPDTGWARYARLLAGQVLASGGDAQVAIASWESGPRPAADVLAVLDGSGRVDPRLPTLSVLYDLAHLLVPGAVRFDERWRRRFTTAWTARQSAAVLAPTQVIARAASRYLRVPSDRLAWLGSVPPGWRRAPRAEVEAFRRRHHLKERYFALVGPLDRRHGVELVAAAWSRAWSAVPGTALVAAGPASDRGQTGIAIAAGITWLGELDGESYRVLLSGAHAALAPAVADGTSAVAWDAMATGAPVLAAAGGGPSEVVGNAGIVLPAGDPAAWAAAMVDLVSDVDRRNALAARGLRAAAALKGGEPAQRLLAMAARARSGSS